MLHTLIAAGQTFDYSVQVPANEPAGLYWYHPHPHGFSEGQVIGGASGALIVQGIQNFNPAVAGLLARVFMIRDQKLTVAEENTSGGVKPANDLSLNFVPVTYPNYQPAIIQTPASEKEFWRVANTSADTLVDLQYLINGTARRDSRSSLSMESRSRTRAATRQPRLRLMLCCRRAPAPNSSLPLLLLVRLRNW